VTAEAGLVVVDKPGGLTSHDVVARVRRLAGTRKVGHAGTLDPMATGVLVLGVGRATRLLGHLTLADKRYDATVRLGVTTTTDDAEGEVVTRATTDAVTEDAVRGVLAGFVGEIDQVPSAVSAIKVDGERAYARARKGEPVDLPARRVTIHGLDVVEVELPDVAIRVHCSSGTYIRAIARDLGSALGVGGHLTSLRRTSVGPFTLAESHTLDDLADNWATTSIADAARAAFTSMDLDDDLAQQVRVGRPLDVSLQELTALFAPDGEFLALYEPREARSRPVAVFV
jgi:tRNA pseudouridine55 synthase